MNFIPSDMKGIKNVHRPTKMKTNLIQYLRRGAVMKLWKGFEGDQLRVDYGFEFFCRHGTKLHWDHLVHLTVALQDRDVLVAT